MIKQVLIASAFTAALAFSASTLAATFTGTDSGKSYVVTGIDDVVVDGVKYNVRFGDTWNDEVTYDKRFALSATKALMNFYASVEHRSDVDLSQYTINGCSSLTNCDIATAFRFVRRFGTDISIPIEYWQSVDVMLKGTTASFAADASHTFGLFLDDDTVVTKATWVPSVSAVPVPAAALMFAPALLGFAALRRKKRA